MFSYTATIGRNYSTSTTVAPSMRGQVMTLTRWGTFVDDVSEAMRVAIEKTRETDSYAWSEDAEFSIEVHYGKGMWDGVSEESAKISVLSTEPITHLNWLKGELGELRKEYGQDAIALTIGESELI